MKVLRRRDTGKRWSRCKRSLDDHADRRGGTARAGADARGSRRRSTDAVRCDRRPTRHRPRADAARPWLPAVPTGRRSRSRRARWSSAAWRRRARCPIRSNTRARTSARTSVSTFPGSRPHHPAPVHPVTTGTGGSHRAGLAVIAARAGVERANDRDAHDRPGRPRARRRRPTPTAIAPRPPTLPTVPSLPLPIAVPQPTVPGDRRRRDSVVTLPSLPTAPP